MSRVRLLPLGGETEGWCSSDWFFLLRTSPGRKINLKFWKVIDVINNERNAMSLVGVETIQPKTMTKPLCLTVGRNIWHPKKYWAFFIATLFLPLFTCSLRGCGSPVVKVSDHSSYTRAFCEEPRNLEPWSSEERNTHASFLSRNFNTTPTEGHLILVIFNVLTVSSARRGFSDTRLELMIRHTRVRYIDL
ncbi:hypothetical protein TNCV_4022501 [Trichonephila clavipes]|nr:hypothetical protein TNCV_4022501 [Trichonephila clavipes]